MKYFWIFYAILITTACGYSIFESMKSIDIQGLIGLVADIALIAGLWLWITRRTLRVPKLWKGVIVIGLILELFDIARYRPILDMTAILSLLLLFPLYYANWRWTQISDVPAN